MSKVRRATAADTAELVRLRGVLMATMAGHGPDADGWRQAAGATFRARLAEPNPTLAAFVVDQPDRPGALASCAVGVIEHRLGGPGNPTGEVGYVFSVATDPEHRRRGYFRRCMTALLGWYRDRGIGVIDLRASSDAEPLYRSLGFARTSDPSMRLRLPAADSRPPSDGGEDPLHLGS